MAETKHVPAEEVVFGDLADDPKTKSVADGFNSLGEAVGVVKPSANRHEVKTREAFAAALGFKDLQMRRDAEMSQKTPSSKGKHPPITVEKLS